VAEEEEDPAKVVRGGLQGSDPDNFRSAIRIKGYPDAPYDVIGFGVWLRPRLLPSVLGAGV
jgi:hypothetical protein